LSLYIIHIQHGGQKRTLWSLDAAKACHLSHKSLASTNTMPPAPTALRKTLLALQQRDLDLRDELQADGMLLKGYHPRMEAMHRDNASELRALIARVGWPNEKLAGRDGAEAAWLVAQHAIAEPDFMRSCRALLEREVAAGQVPLWQYAYLDDRIRVFEGKPQRFGTQFELTPDGPSVCEVEDLNLLNKRREEAGLEPISARLRHMQHDPRPTPSEFKAKKAAEMKWRRSVGWYAPSDA
jgi:hypothetical protein